MEECAEIQKEAAKALRFGLDDHAPNAPETSNAEGIALECVDLLAIVEMLEEGKIIPALKAPERIQKKKDKVLKYMRYAQKRGTLAE
jgi:hypothetical protein